MAVAETTKVFNFRIEIDGVDQFEIQDVKIPEVTVGKVEHGATNHNIKTAGGVEIGDAELQKVRKAIGSDNFAWNWITTAQNTATGTGSLNYKKNVVLKELAPNGIVVNAWLWIGCWVTKTSASNFKRGNQNENTIETVTLSVDRVEKVI